MVIVVWYEAPLTVYLLRFLTLSSVTDSPVSAAPMPGFSGRLYLRPRRTALFRH
jgi:hypothetical protein